MKKWIIIGAAVVAAGAGAFFYVRQSQAAKSASPQTTAKAERGQVRSVVASTGRVVANQDVDIKCKASGEIIELPFNISDEVKEGELLLKLDPNDQERILRQTEVALQASQAKLATAQENLQIAQRTLITDEAKAKSDLQTAQAKAKDARAKADRTKQLFDKKLSSQEELDTAETAATQAAGDLRTAEVKLEELKTQEAALELKRQDVKLAEAAVESDKIARDVANDRVHDTIVVAPIDGVVSARNIQIGQIISSGISNVGGGTTVLTLSDLSRIFIYASVDESDIGRVKLGQDVDITADAFPGRTFHGKVVRIATRGANVSNVVTFEVRIEVLADRADRRGRGAAGGPSSQTQAGPEADDPPGEPFPTGRQASSGPASQPASGTSQRRFLLKPEMTANVELIAAQKSDVVTVPVEALLRKSGKYHVTVVKDGGATEDREVVPGISDGVRTEVVSGIEEGQTVLVRKGGADSRWNGGQRPGGPPMGVPGGGRGR